MTGMSGAVWLAVAALVPIVILMMTSFVKISVVLSLLRNALGAPDAPSGLVVTGLSLILTFFVMAPVGVAMLRAAAEVPAERSDPDKGATQKSAGGASSASGTSAGGAPSASGTSAGGAPSASGTSGGGANSATVEKIAGGAPSASGTSGAGAKSATVERIAGGAPSVSGTSGGGAKSATGGAPSVSGTSAGGAKRATVEKSAGPPSVGAVPSAGGEMHDVDAAVRALVPAEYRGPIDAVMRGLGPLRGFLVKHAAPRDRETFVALAKKMGNEVRGDELWVLAPAFIATELREAFAIAVLIFVPFLVIDLLVGLGLAALGLGATAPQVVALPMKLLLFVGVDGWRLLLDALLRGYA